MSAFTTLLDDFTDPASRPPGRARICDIKHLTMSGAHEHTDLDL